MEVLNKSRCSLALLSASTSFIGCYFCDGKINLSGQFDGFENLKLCQKFCTLVGRYYNFSSDITAFSNNSGLLSTLNSKTWRDNVLLQGKEKIFCCGRCSKKLELFCKIYEQWTKLQIRLNHCASEIATTMRISERNENDGKSSDNATSSSRSRFWKQFLESVATGQNNFPRLKVSKLNTVKDNLPDPDLTDAQDSDSEPFLDSNSNPPTPLENEDSDSDSDSDKYSPETTRRKIHLPVASRRNHFQNVGKPPKSQPKPSQSKSSVKNGKFKCRFCDATHKTYNGRYQHELGHKGKKFVCRFCGWKFLRKQALQNHERIHTGQKPYVCRVCSKRFTQHSACVSHQIHLHKEERECIKDFGGEDGDGPGGGGESDENTANETGNEDHDDNSNELTNVVISGDLLNNDNESENEPEPQKSYPCKFCKKTFVRKCNLYQHQIIHATVKPFKCQFCGRQFAQKNSMAGHERQHMGIKPFECGICGKRYSQWAPCRKHQKVTHGTSNAEIKKHFNQGIKLRGRSYQQMRRRTETEKNYKEFTNHDDDEVDADVPVKLERLDEFEDEEPTQHDDDDEPSYYMEANIGEEHLLQITKSEAHDSETGSVQS